MPIRVLVLSLFLGSFAWGEEVSDGAPPAAPAAESSAPTAVLHASPVAAPGTVFERWQAELPPWLQLGAEIRGRIENYFGLSGIPGRDNSYYLHRLRLNTTIQVAPWIRLVAQAQDSREVGYDRAPVPYSVANPLELRQGYVELGLRGNDAPWTVRAGRQPLIFGDTRLVSTSNWGNVGANYDALRLSVRQSGVRLDAFTALVVVPCVGFDRPRKDKRLSGFYSSSDVFHKKVTVDAYVFWKKNLQTVDLFTYGIRSVGKMAHGLDYTVEVALQRGRVSGQGDAAWAGHWELGRTWKAWGGTARLAAEYSYATGDQTPHDGHYQSFDQLYPTNVYGTAGDFGWRNLHEPVTYVELQPTKKWKVKTAYHLFWLAQTEDALYTLTGAVWASDPSATDSRVGSEIDTRIIRQMNKNLQFWVGYAHLFPGPYLKQAGKGAVNFPYVMWTFSF